MHVLAALQSEGRDRLHALSALQPFLKAERRQVGPISPSTKTHDSDGTCSDWIQISNLGVAQKLMRPELLFASENANTHLLLPVTIK